jgi:small multidrug resistance pump
MIMIERMSVLFGIGSPGAFGACVSRAAGAQIGGVIDRRHRGARDERRRDTAWLASVGGHAYALDCRLASSGGRAMHWLLLILAIVAEVIGTTALKASAGFTRPGAVVVVVFAYGTAFYLLARVLLVLPLGVTYAIWSGLGVAAVTVIGLVVYGQKLDTAAWVGIGLIVAVVMVLNLLSDTTAA